MDLSKYSILKCFFGQIWSQKLKFSKLTEIWSRHTLLYPCFEFSVNFLKKFFTHIFWGNWSQNLKFCTRVHYYMFITTLTYFCKIFVIHNFFGQIWLQFGPNSLIVNSFSVSQLSTTKLELGTKYATM